ncbi:MAG TPA: PfkB family carbohydrate kinase [Candidatus Limnocylindrales bacterium]|nr:PfkB family carbohydrate kinase [Candidatus Limnocylindrales bacterium]
MTAGAPAAMPATPEAFVVGRIGVDLTPTAARTSLVAADTFVRSVGGFAGNISFGLARQGVATAVLSSVGADGHGAYVRSALGGEGIDVAGLTARTVGRTQVAFFEAWPPDDFPVTFYRSDPAPETQLELGDLPRAALERARLVIVSATLLAAEPARSTTLALLAERHASRDRRPASWTILDLDWRPGLWADLGDHPSLTAEAVRLSDVVIGSDAEFAAAGLRPGATGDPGPGLTVLKHGPDGASVLADGDRRSVPGIPVEVTCGLGAGDGLTAAFAAGLLHGLSPAAALERGNAAGAIVASRLMCSTAMPTPGEIDELIARGSLQPAEASR